MPVAAKPATGTDLGNGQRASEYGDNQLIAHATQSGSAVPERAHGMHTTTAENLDSLTATINAFFGRIQGTQIRKLSHLVKCLPTSAGGEPGVIDLMPTPQQSKRVISDAGERCDAFAACVWIVDLDRRNDCTLRQLCSAAVMNRRDRDSGRRSRGLKPLAHAT
jgi:hypothetical protein